MLVQTLKSVDTTTANKSNPLDAQKQSYLMKQVTRLLEHTNEDCTDDILTLYDTVLTRLADVADPQTRLNCSQRVATMVRAPRGITVKFANDSVNIAAPVILKSSHLTDEDLVQLVHKRGSDHIKLVAQRPEISELVSNNVVALGDTVTHGLLIQNDTASLSRDSFKALISQSEKSKTLRNLMSHREDIPKTLLPDLIRISGDDERDTLLARYGESALEQVTKVRENTIRKFETKTHLSAYNFREARANLYAMVQDRKVTQALIRQLATQDHFPEMLLAFSMLSGVRVTDAQNMLVSSDPKPFMIAARANGLENDTVKSILQCGPWRKMLSRTQRSEAYASYEGLTEELAKRIFKAWVAKQGH